MIDGYELTIVENAGRASYVYKNPDRKPLWKIYKWYLTRDSDKYNIPYKDGMRVLHRHNVVTMELRKTKIEDVWSKDDEAKTD